MSFGRSIKINRNAVFVLIVISVIVIYVYNISTNKSSHVKSATEINLRKLLIGSIQAAQKGGGEILAVSKSSAFNKKSKGKTKEGADDPITDADSRSHCVMKSGLHRIFPKLEIISEEDKNRESCENLAHFDLDPTVLHETAVIPDEIVSIKDVTVWIDPMDATQEFTEQLFKYVTTMICVAVKGYPVIGVIHNPFTQKTTWAWVNKSNSQDLNKVKKEEAVSRNPVVIVSRSHAGDVKNISKQIFGENTHILVAAGAGYKVLQVVFNNATAYLHTTRIKKWDICAGNAMLNAVGGKMTNLLNEPIDYSGNDSPIHDKGILSTLNNHKVYMKKIISNKILFS